MHLVHRLLDAGQVEHRLGQQQRRVGRPAAQRVHQRVRPDVTLRIDIDQVPPLNRAPHLQRDTLDLSPSLPCSGAELLNSTIGTLSFLDS